MHTADALALSIIQPFESCRLVAYLCSSGVPTIGWGATGPDVRLGMTWTQAQCDARLLMDLAKFSRGVAALVKVPLNARQLGALISLAYNIGLTALSESTLLRLLNSGDVAGASAQFPRWNRDRKKVSKGLIRRRKAEKDMFDGN